MTTRRFGRHDWLGLTPEVERFGPLLVARIAGALGEPSDALGEKRIERLIRCQSARLGVRPSGSLASSASISASPRPSRCAIRMKLKRRMSLRRNRRWLPAVRKAWISPLSS